MKRTKKILAMLLCAVLLVTGTVAVTVAYLTASTDVVTNTFTVGKVEIELDETDVTAYGEKESDTRVKANSYKLIPGHEYIKDPTVHVKVESEPCWLFVKVDNGLVNIEDETTIASQMTTNGWSLVEGTTNVYSYKDIVDAQTAAVDKVVFNTFTLKNDADVASYASAKITIDAYAVQADGFATAADAWKDASTTWDN